MRHPPNRRISDTLALSWRVLRGHRGARPPLDFCAGLHITISHPNCRSPPRTPRTDLAVFRNGLQEHALPQQCGMLFVGFRGSRTAARSIVGGEISPSAFAFVELRCSRRFPFGAASSRKISRRKCVEAVSSRKISQAMQSNFDVVVFLAKVLDQPHHGQRHE